VSKRVGIPFHLVSVASNNAQIVKGGRGLVSAVWATNINAAICFLKFFDVATLPNPLTDAAHFVCGIPGGAAAGAGGSLAIPGGLCFDNGIAFAIVTGAADGNNTAVAAGEVVISFVYR
jgi:hypothetical protein